MLFDTAHILYMVISGLITALTLVLAGLFIKDEKHKETFLKVVAIVTIILHYSIIWVEYFGNGESTDGLEASHLLPIYPCHIMMWLLFIASRIKNKKSKAFGMLAEFCFFGGIVCSTLGIVLNDNYEGFSSFADWEVLKGLISHSTLLLGCIYMRVGNFMKIRMSGIISVCLGLMFFIVDGMFANWLFAVCGLEEVNAMYLLYSPIESMPWLTPYLMGAAGVALLFILLSIYELFLPREERWYFKIKKLVSERLKKVDVK